MHQDNAGAVVAAISQVLLALFGVEYYAMLWAFIGSLFALSQVKQMSRLGAIAYVILSTIAGAALGTVFVEWVGSQHRAYLIFGSLLGGAGAQILVPALMQAVLSRIGIKTTLGGATNETPDSAR